MDQQRRGIVYAGILCALGLAALALIIAAGIVPSIGGRISTALIASVIGFFVPHTLAAIGNVLLKGPPIRLSLEVNPDKIRSFGSVGRIVLAPVDERIHDAPTFDSFDEWARRHRAVDVGESRLRLVVEGRAEDTVLITDLRAKILAPIAAPSNGIPLVYQSAGAVAVRRVTISLDSPNLQAIQPPEGPGEREPKGFEFTLEKGQVEVFDISVTATGVSASWVLELHYTHGGRQAVMSIPGANSPLRTLGLTLDRFYEWDYRDGWLDNMGAPAPVPLASVLLKQTGSAR